MKLGVMVGDIVSSLFKRPVTELYPVERTPAPERLRGKVFYEPDVCTGCGLCVKDCPSEALELIVIDRAKKRYIMHYYTDRCTFCSQCVESCRTGSIRLSNEEWELAALDKDHFMITYGRKEDIETVLAKAATHAPSIVGRSD